MGNYSCRRDKLLVGWEIDVAQRVFQGKSNREIAIEILEADPSDKNDFKRKMSKLKHLIESKKFMDYYKSMITEWTVHNVGRALTKLTEQVDHDQPWLANKAANDILQRAPKSLFTDEDENTIKVVVEGAPVLGTPEDK